MVKFTALALGTTVIPLFSILKSSSVLIASISGTIKSGLTSSTRFANFFASSISKTTELSATCMAGALAYLSHAMTSHPSLFALIVNSFPNSPLPNNKIFFIIVFLKYVII